MEHQPIIQVPITFSLIFMRTNGLQLGIYSLDLPLYSSLFLRSFNPSALESLWPWIYQNHWPRAFTNILYCKWFWEMCILTIPHFYHTLTLFCYHYNTINSVIHQPVSMPIIMENQIRTKSYKCKFSHLFRSSMCNTISSVHSKTCVIPT